LVENDNKYGYIDKKGNYVINCQYGYASSFFDDGYAIVVNSDKKYTIINKKGEELPIALDAIYTYDEVFCCEDDCYEDGYYEINDKNYCYDHRPICQYSSCYNYADEGGYCYRHQPKECDYYKCNKTVYGEDYCYNHRYRYCEYYDCYRRVYDANSDYCYLHE